MSKRKKAAARRMRIVVYAVLAGLLIGFGILAYEVWEIQGTLKAVVIAVVKMQDRY